MWKTKLSWNKGPKCFGGSGINSGHTELREQRAGLWTSATLFSTEGTPRGSHFSGSTRTKSLTRSTRGSTGVVPCEQCCQISTIRPYLFWGWRRWRGILDDLKEPNTGKNKVLHWQQPKGTDHGKSDLVPPKPLRPPASWQPLLPAPLSLHQQGLLEITTIRLPDPAIPGLQTLWADVSATTLPGRMSLSRGEEQPVPRPHRVREQSQRKSVRGLCEVLHSRGLSCCCCWGVSGPVTSVKCLLAAQASPLDILDASAALTFPTSQLHDCSHTPTLLTLLWVRPTPGSISYTSI